MSIYNSTRFCSLHTQHDKSFNVHVYIDTLSWSKEALHADEVAVLTILSNPINSWHLLNDSYLGGRHKANNIVRRLRRKGFCITSKRSGGYQLLDCIPSLMKGGSCDEMQTS